MFRKEKRLVDKIKETIENGYTVDIDLSLREKINILQMLILEDTEQYYSDVFTVILDEIIDYIKKGLIPDVKQAIFYKRDPDMATKISMVIAERLMLFRLDEKALYFMQNNVEKERFDGLE